MDQVYVKGQLMEFDPSKRYATAEIIGGAIKFDDFHMEQFMEMLSDECVRKRDKIGAINYNLSVLRNNVFLSILQTERAASVAHYILADPEDRDRYPEMVEGVRNTLEVLERVKEIYETP